MEKLEVFETTNAFTNVACGRPFVSPIELHERTLNALVGGVAMFSFLKTDGTTVRHAIGTLNPKLIPSKLLELGEENIFNALALFRIAHETLVELRKGKEDRNPEVMERYQASKQDIGSTVEKIKPFMEKITNTKERKRAEGVQSFFDVEAQAWKSYKTDNLLALIQFPVGE